MDRADLDTRGMKVEARVVALEDHYRLWLQLPICRHNMDRQGLNYPLQVDSIRKAHRLVIYLHIII
jgi:hypothetical protein